LSADSRLADLGVPVKTKRIGIARAEGHARHLTKGVIGRRGHGILPIARRKQ
jgi:hypothetical protein